ncbi:uncharacterized protein LOC133925783 [Phragmites australis]|uniref:uncharacterized protein LOC133925783 n=1 Tax=Phragmites australis TaxID=29695 RepID=UPI002D78419C|nr:uncharacterized protein LOC133925783 [Phragmites australis]
MPRNLFLLLVQLRQQVVKLRPAVMYRRLFAWLLVLVVLVLVCSCAATVCSSRTLDAGGDARKLWTAGGGGVATAGRGSRVGRKVWNRRSLGDRSSWLPPSPLSNRATAMPAPPPPWV